MLRSLYQTHPRPFSTCSDHSYAHTRSLQHASNQTFTASLGHKTLCTPGQDGCCISRRNDPFHLVRMQLYMSIQFVQLDISVEPNGKARLKSFIHALRGITRHKFCCNIFRRAVRDHQRLASKVAIKFDVLRVLRFIHSPVVSEFD
jgi:hypothetical protein